MEEETRHVCFNIDGMVRNMGRKNWKGMFEDENGNFLSHKQALEFVQECKAKGYKYFPNHLCKGFDPFENGCPGHKKED